MTHEPTNDEAPEIELDAFDLTETAELDGEDDLVIKDDTEAET